MGISADEVQSVADRSSSSSLCRRPLFQRYQPFAARAAAAGRGRFGPIYTHVRIKPPRTGAVPGLDSAWMLDPAEPAADAANLGPHGLDMFLYLTGGGAGDGRPDQSPGARQLVEDYASVLLRSSSGILGTIEVGNGFPRVARTAIGRSRPRRHPLLKDGVLKLATAEGDETTPVRRPCALLRAIRDALDAWQRGAPPPISVHDCVRAVRLIDRPTTSRADLSEVVM